MAAAPAAPAAKLVVNTPRDVIADVPFAIQAEWIAGSLGDPDMKAHPVVASCLGSDESGEGVRSTLAQSVEEPVNEPLSDKPVDSVAVARPCSLRMALTAASLLRAGTASGGDRNVLITFSKDVREPVEVLGEEAADILNAGNAALLPPLVDPAETASPASPLLEGSIEIDGCQVIDNAADSPCVDIKLPSRLEIGDLPTSLVGDGALPGLLIGGPRVTIDRIAFLGGGTAIATTPSAVAPASSGKPAVGEVGSSLTVTRSYFGMDEFGDVQSEDDAPSAAIQLSGYNATIGGVTADKRNVFAAGGTGVLIAGGSRNKVQGNWFGVGKDGRRLEDRSLGTAVRVTGARVASDRVDDTAVGLAASAAALDSDSPVPDGATSTAVQVFPSKNQIGGSRTGDPGARCDGPCNLIAATSGIAIDVGGPALQASGGNAEGDPPAPAGTTIQGNWIGVQNDRRAGEIAPEGNAAIAVRNDSVQTTIGGTEQDGNLIVNTRGPAVLVADNAGDDTTIENNFVAFGFGNDEMLIDLDGEAGDEASVSPDGPGNRATGPSGGVQAPTIVEATTQSVRGTASPNGTVHVYLVPAGGEDDNQRGDVSRLVGVTNSGADGSWSIDQPTSLAAGQKVTATVDAGKGTSELAVNATVVAVQVQKSASPPPAPAPPPPPPPPPPADREAPRIVSVFGRSAPADPAKPVTVPMPATLNGRARDTSGVARVDVALALPARATRSRTRPRARTCSFVDFRRARFVRRSCAKPLFARASGTGTWRLPLTRKARKLLRKGRTYTLYVRTADRLGNTATKTLLIRFR